MCDIGNSTRCSVAGTGHPIWRRTSSIEVTIAGTKRKPDAFKDHQRSDDSKAGYIIEQSLPPSWSSFDQTIANVILLMFFESVYIDLLAIVNMDFVILLTALVAM